LACSGESTTGAGGSGGSDANGPGPSQSGSGAGSPASSGSMSTASGTSSSGMSTASTGTGGGLPTGTLRFVALGDGGEGNATQYKVADAVKSVCDAKGGCDFALYLGDNFYDTGVDSVNDAQFSTKFEQPYMNIDFRFFVVLGNHDYGGGGTGNEFGKGQYQVDYSQMSSKFTMPSNYYTFSTPADAGPADAPLVQFFGLDTNLIMWGQGINEQKSWLDAAVQASSATWKIAFGHHTYISNGAHGVAGDYEDLPFVPIVNGESVKDFFDDSICNRVDVYICGHDHNRQWLEPRCGVEFMVSGTAAKETDLDDEEVPTFFENDQNAGFLLVEMTSTSMTGTFYDEDQVVEFTRTITK
jgi:hypothetical protein